jgi:hypothetical protein
MSTVTDAEVEAALQSWFKDGSAWNRQMTPDVQQDMRVSMRAALEAAEAVRVKAEPIKGNCLVDLPRSFTITPTIPEGFIPWHGADCPVAEGTVVEVIYRSGGRSPPVPACVHVKSGLQAVRWTHHWKDGGFFAKDDIIAYRIHKPADFRLEAGRFYVTASGERVGPMRHNPGAYGSTYQVSGDWGRWWWPNGEIGLLGSCEPDILALSSNQENNHD